MLIKKLKICKIALQVADVTIFKILYLYISTPTYRFTIIWLLMS